MFRVVADPIGLVSRQIFPIPIQQCAYERSNEVIPKTDQLLARRRLGERTWDPVKKTPNKR